MGSLKALGLRFWVFILETPATNIMQIPKKLEATWADL